MFDFHRHIVSDGEDPGCVLSSLWKKGSCIEICYSKLIEDTGVYSGEICYSCSELIADTGVSATTHKLRNPQGLLDYSL